MTRRDKNDTQQWTKRAIVAACLAMFSTMGAADTIAGVYAGVGVWRAGAGGNLGSTAADVDTLGLSTENDAFVYVAVEHPVPLLPNVKLQHSRLAFRGEGALSGEFRLDDVEFPAGEPVSTDLDLTHTDAVLYYELLDNVVSLDLGLTFRVFDGHARVSSRDRSLGESVDIDLVIPAAYGRALIGLPRGLSLGTAANIVGYSGNSLTDLSAHLAYSYESAVDVGVELGYRRFTVKLDDDAETDVDVGGPYLTVTLHF